MAEDLKEKRLQLLAQLEELQEQEDAEKAAAALLALNRPLDDALQRATTAEARVVELEATSQELETRSEQLETKNRRLERTNMHQRQQIEELTGRVSGAVQTVLDGVTQSADALAQASSNMKSFSSSLQSVVEALTMGIAAKPDTSTARTSGTRALSHAHMLASLFMPVAQHCPHVFSRLVCSHSPRRLCCALGCARSSVLDCAFFSARHARHARHARRFQSRRQSRPAHLAWHEGLLGPSLARALWRQAHRRSRLFRQGSPKEKGQV